MSQARATIDSMTTDEERRARNAAKQRRYKERHPGRVKASMDKWRAANPEKARAATKSWEERNAEYVKAKRKADWADPETRKKKQQWLAAWSERNREKLTQKSLAYQKAHPEKVKVWQNARKARKRNAAIVDLTTQDWADLLVEHDFACFYCGATGVKLEQEHKTPLVRGGNHTKTNVVPACGPCNRRKFTKTAEEFLACR